MAQQKEMTRKEKLIASLERKIKNRTEKIRQIEEKHKEAVFQQEEDLEILVIQYNALKK